MVFEPTIEPDVFALLEPTGLDRRLSLDDLKKLTYALMEALGIGYDNRTTAIVDQQPEDAKLFRPFALILACLAGNPFEDALEQYIDDARNIIHVNGWTRDDVRALLGKANESLFAHRTRLIED